MPNPATKPRILCFSGLDPSGGAGIQADIETLLVHNCHCLPLITLNSVQDSQGLFDLQPVDTTLIEQQASKLIADGEVSAIKIGMLANAEQVTLLCDIIDSLKGIPVVLDPVLGTGLQTKLDQSSSAQSKLDVLVNALLPRCLLISPNSLEARALYTNSQTHHTQPQPLKQSLSTEYIGVALQKLGVNNVLITGTHEDEGQETITHRLFSDSCSKNYSVPRLKGHYHGSGCTLASAICAHLAHEHEIDDAITQALSFTHKSLNSAQALGKHQLFPNRFIT